MARSPVVGTGAAVVSMTTYGRRAALSYLALESIARGSVKPRRLILWVDEEALLRNPPRTLRRLQRRGLEILPCVNYRAHKKYYPYVSSQSAPSEPLVTADDDALYWRGWLAELIAAHTATSDIVVCHRAHRLEKGESGLKPYLEWQAVSDTNPDLANFATGVGGVLYPPRAQQVLADAGDGFLTTCLGADDVWINSHLARAGIPVRQASLEGRRPRIIRRAQVEALWRENVVDGLNDEYLARCYDAPLVQEIIRS